MNGTPEDDREARLREPSPFVAELQERMRDIYANGAEPWNDPLEKRRAERRRDMQLLRISNMEVAVHTGEYICSRLPGWKREPFEHVKDPVASLANLNRAIVQITLAEDRFDESGEERLARIKAEAKAEVDARLQAERTLRRAETKRDVENSVRAIALDHIRLPFDLREARFKALFAGLDDDDFDADPAEIVTDLCTRMSLAPVIAPDEEAQTPDGQIDLAARKAKLLAFARQYLKLMKIPAPVDDRDEAELADPPEPPVRAQGPPH
jgi:hypothetical protein